MRRKKGGEWYGTHPTIFLTIIFIIILVPYKLIGASTPSLLFLHLFCGLLRSTGDWTLDTVVTVMESVQQAECLEELGQSWTGMGGFS